MSLKEKAQEIKEKYPQLEVDFNKARNQIGIYGFHALENAQEARQELEGMGFELGPNGGTMREEKKEEVVIPQGIIKRDAWWMSLTPEERREHARQSTNGHGVDEKYEKGWWNDDQVLARMFAPRREAMLAYLKSQK